MEYKKIHEFEVDNFEKIWKSADENARFLRGKHWTESEVKEHEDDFRKAYSVPLVATKINRILSEQRNNRAKWKPKPRGREDEVGAEIGAYVMEYIDEINEFKWTESEVYMDGMAKKYGVLCVRIDNEKNPQGEILLEKIPLKEFLWDSDAVRYDLTDARYVQRFGWFTREYIKTLYPEKSKEIDGLSADNTTKKGYWYKKERNKEFIKIVWHYEKAYKTKYLVTDLLSGETFQSDSKEDEILYNSIKIKQPYIKVICFCDETILDESEIEGEYPFAVYFALFDDGYYWSLVDLAKDPQRFYDRLLSMIDKSTVKNIKGNNYLIYPDRLHDTETKDADKLMLKLSKGGAVVKAIAENPITPIEKYNNIAVELNLTAMTQGLIEDLLGGRTYQGLETKQQTTATEVSLVNEAAKAAGMLYLDNLARWKKRVGELIWKLIPEVYTEGRTIRIIGDEKMAQLSAIAPVSESNLHTGMGYLEITDKLGKINVDIIMDEVSGSKTMKEQQLNTLLAVQEMILRAVPGAAPLPVEIFLPFLNIDSSIKGLLIKYYKDLAESQAAKEEEGKKMAQAQIVDKFDTNQLEREKLQADTKNKQTESLLNIAKQLNNGQTKTL